jgi:LmbE family N-acetylglucosaminyl deacetylase
VVTGLTANRIDRPGTPEEAWDSWPDLRHLPPADLSAWPSVVVIAAHPDDEVLGVGGTMAILAAAGVRMRLIAVTDGEASHPDADPAAVGRTRTAESAAALGLLGVREAEVVRLRLPDTGLPAHEDELAGLLRELCAGFEVCLAPWAGDAHADHEAAGRAARQAGSAGGRILLSYPIWMWHWAEPADPRVPWPRACQVPLPAGVAARKQLAIQAFASQLTDRGPGLGPVLPRGIAAHFTRGQEVLLR